MQLRSSLRVENAETGPWSVSFQPRARFGFLEAWVGFAFCPPVFVPCLVMSFDNRKQTYSFWDKDESSSDMLPHMCAEVKIYSDIVVVGDYIKQKPLVTQRINLGR